MQESSCSIRRQDWRGYWEKKILPVTDRPWCRRMVIKPALLVPKFCKYRYWSSRAQNISLQVSRVLPKVDNNKITNILNAHFMPGFLVMWCAYRNYLIFTTIYEKSSCHYLYFIDEEKATRCYTICISLPGYKLRQFIFGVLVINK